MANGEITVTIAAELRRQVAGAIYAAAANLSVRAARAREGTRRRAELIAESQALREVAEEIQP